MTKEKITVRKDVLGFNAWGEYRVGVSRSGTAKKIIPVFSEKLNLPWVMCRCYDACLWKDKCISVREEVAEALEEIGDLRAVNPLIHVLSDEGGFVRSSVAKALGVIGDQKAVEPLIQARKTGNMLDLKKAIKELEIQEGDVIRLTPSSRCRRE
jgi:hypothetical protein